MNCRGEPCWIGRGGRSGICAGRPGRRCCGRCNFRRSNSRPELTEATGLSQASVSNVVRELLDEGMVIEAGSVLLGDRMLPAIREAAGRHALRHPFAATSIELGRLGPEALTLGAATLPVERFLHGAGR
ncbi:MAG: hypothetical protein ABSA53_40215 [Streptosporangiaceae bacterium]